MTELDRIIQERRSIKAYKDEMPSKEAIDQIMEAGLYAASGRGLQASKLIAITDRDLRDRLSKVNGSIMNAPEDYDPFYNAPVVLLVLGEAEVGTCVYDGSLTLGNMMLKAHELGISSCWIHRAKEEMEMEIGKEILERAGLEGEYIGIGHLILGYAAEEKKCPERKPGRIFYI